jgi:UDP-glucuronate 4-epimerase
MILVTGSAGFIGHGVCKALLARGENVVGLDSFNAYYEPALKRARVADIGAQAAGATRFRQVEMDLADGAGLKALVARERPDRIVHLAAQAGVRYSFENPDAYVSSNLAGFVNLLEAARGGGGRSGVKHIVYASSSSVYGANTKLPFSVDDPVERPISLYAATKRANELIARVYALQFGLALTGLRFFTVYGPWGRPDMAPLKFTRAILAGRPIEVYGQGAMRRDFTYIDDIVAGTLAALDDEAHFGDASAGARHRLYNLGNHRPEELMHFIDVLARAVGRPARLELQPMQAGDVRETYADIEATTRDLGWRPTTSIEEGVPRLVQWCRGYDGS